MTAESGDARLVVERRAHGRRAAARRRIAAALGDADADSAASALLRAGRLTVNFHPDRRAPGGTVIEGMLADGAYRSQYTTGISNGSRSAVPGGLRTELERAMFGDAYDPSPADRPIYATLDLLNDMRGGSPGFGSCHLVLHPSVRDHCTFSVGDSHRSPPDLGTTTEPLSILAGLAEQAAAGALLDRPLGLDALGSLIAGDTPPRRTDRRLESYVEAQVHGGVDLTRDVAEVVADPAFRHRPEGAHLVALAHLAGCDLRWHGGNELAAAEFPSDFRATDLPTVAARIARSDGVVDAACIGDMARAVPPQPPRPDGDQATHPLQQVKHLWQALVVFGADAAT